MQIAFTDDDMAMIPEKKRVEVAAAIIRSGDRILATQRGYGEFKDGWELLLKEELNTVDWLPADLELIEELKQELYT